MAWRLAKSLEKLRTQIDLAYPARDRSSDGTIGDERHAHLRSDHNPRIKDGKMGVVTAIDITNDPINGMASEDLARALAEAKDPRIKYIISNKKIVHSKTSPWVWRKYTGTNPHSKHVHLSVNEAKSLYDSTKAWQLPIDLEEAEVVDDSLSSIKPIIPELERNPDIAEIQKNLVALGYYEIGGIDGIFGTRTVASIAAFKKDWNLPGEPVIDRTFKAALDKAVAEGWKRPILIERAEATPAQVASKAPEMVPAEQSKKVGFFASIMAFLAAAGSAAADAFKDILTWLEPVKVFFATVPGYVWFGIASAAALAFAINAARSSSRIVEAFRTGERN